MLVNHPELYTVEAARHHVSSRLRFSKWFARGMLATGLGSGLFISDVTNEDSRSKDRIAIGLALTASVATVGERILARSKVERTIKKFTSLRVEWLDNRLTENGQTNNNQPITQGGNLSLDTVNDRRSHWMRNAELCPLVGNPIFAHFSSVGANRVLHGLPEVSAAATAEGAGVVCATLAFVGILNHFDGVDVEKLKLSGYDRITSIANSLGLESNEEI